MRKNIDLYYVHLFNDFSGSPRVLRDAIDSNITNPSDTYVFTSKHSGFLDGVNANRIDIFYRRSNNRYVQLFYFLISQLILFVKLSIRLILGYFKGRKATIVVNTMLPFGAALSSILVNSKLVYYVHETHIKPDALKFFLRFFIENFANHVIFVSKYLQTVESFAKPQQTVIYNGLRSDFPLIENIDVNKKFLGKELFFAGSLKSYKGIEQLIDVAKSLPEFNVVAAINCELDELIEFCSKREKPNNITFISRPKNIQSYFENSFAVLNLSLPDCWIETFGLSLIEGMAFGTPVIAPPIGGPTEFVDNSNGLLVDSRDTEKIVKFLRYLDSSVDVWALYSKKSFAMSKKFLPQKYKESFKDYLRDNHLV